LTGGSQRPIMFLMLNNFKMAFAKPWEARKFRIRSRLAEIWQGKSDVRRDYDWIPLYFRYRQRSEPETVDDKTWSDLEMDEVFAAIDRTTSVIGRQYLYALLRIFNSGDLDRENTGVPVSMTCSEPTPLSGKGSRELYIHCGAAAAPI